MTEKIASLDEHKFEKSLEEEKLKISGMIDAFYGGKKIAQEPEKLYRKLQICLEIADGTITYLAILGRIKPNFCDPKFKKIIIDWLKEMITRLEK